jgi:hypothetical protein
MKTLFAFACVSLFCLVNGFADETKPQIQRTKSPLVGDGALQKVRGPLEEMLQFTFQGNRLALDRKGWEKEPKEKEGAKPGALPPNVGQPNVAPPNIQIKPGAFGQQRIQIQGGFNIAGAQNIFGQGPPIEAIFAKIQAASGSMGHGMSITGDKREINFTGESLSGRLQTSGTSVRLVLEENQSPQRTLEFSDDGSGGFRIEVRNIEGDLLLLQQSRNGSFAAISFTGGPILAAQGDSFLACFQQNRQAMEARVLPVLAQFGINLILSPELPKIRNAVLAQLMQTPEIRAEGQKLIEELDSSEFAVREKASEVLGNRFEIYQDLFLAKLQDKTTPLEVRTRLQAIVNGHTDQQRVAQTVTALGLLSDAGYLVALLDHVAAENVPRVTVHLEKITGQKLGADVAAWKDWAGKSAK